jgi:hypothetical protein
MPWQLVVVFGVVFFVLCYWVVPYALAEIASSTKLPIVRAGMEALAVRRAHWFRYVAIGGALICTYYAIRNFVGARRHTWVGESNSSLIARILARWFD